MLELSLVEEGDEGAKGQLPRGTGHMGQNYNVL